MGKWAKYGKKHHKEWESEKIFQGWLTSSEGSSSSYCKVCEVSLRPQKADLEKHSRTLKHKQHMEKISKRQLTMKQFGISVSNNPTKKKEIILSAYIPMHSTIRSVDHLTDIFNSFSANTNCKPSSSCHSSNQSQTQDILHLHRTKCSSIIKHVIGPSLLQELISDIEESHFSIIVDESTDISTEKLLGINIKYYSKKRNKIVIHFLAFISVVYTTAQDLFEAITDFFNLHKLNLKNLIGIGTDGASNMVGQHNSLYTLLKRHLDLEDLVLVKCICHSLHLCSSKASEVFRDEVDFLLKETYNWFKNSTLRVAKFKQIFDLINTDTKFSRLIQLSNTRWLSRYQAVDKILSQYLELKTFFQMQAGKERCHTAHLLSEAYKNPQNNIILVFLKPILKQVYNLNLYFQKENVDYYQAFTDVSTTIWAFARQIMKPALVNHLNTFSDLENAMKHSNNFLLLTDCDFGIQFEQTLDAAKLPSASQTEIRVTCLEFLKTLLFELLKRMPSNLSLFKQISYLSPKVILSPCRPKFTELPIKFAKCTDISDLETQYRMLLTVNWDEVFPKGIPDDSLEFWQKVAQLKNAADDTLFKEFSQFVFNLLCLPSSNASIERTFSVMNIIKSKLRNRMMVKLLNSIMLLKSHFYVNKICCKDLSVTNEMLARFTSKMYDKDNDDNVTPQLHTLEDVEIEAIISVCSELL